jgi:hypothetical protein
MWRRARQGNLMAMTTFDYAIDIALIALVLLQIQEGPVTPKRMLRPLILIGVAVEHYFTAFPTAGNDLVLELGLLVAGTAIGVGCGVLTHMRRDADGRVLARAGVFAAALWVAAMGGRMAFAYAASHGAEGGIARFSVDHAITGSAAWTTALLLMAIAGAVGRLAVIQVRAQRMTGHLGGAAATVPAA